MNGHELLESLSLVDEKYVTEADKRPLSRHALRRWGSIAAAFCVVIALGLLLPQLGGRVGPSAPGDGVHGSGHEEASVFTSYEGPVLPLTTLEETALTAERHLIMDFGIYGSEEQHYSNYLQVRDSYMLMNPTDGEITAMVSYPVTGSFRDMPETAITVDGTAAESELVAGMYSGGFLGAGDSNTTSMNLRDIQFWEGYRDLLHGGAYMAEAWSDTPVLDDIVTVYEITDITHSAPADAVAPTLAFTFDLPQGTTSFTYGFNGGHYADEGYNLRDFFIPKEGRIGYGDPKYLIFLGKDIDGYTMQGYQNGACEPGEEIPAHATVRRYETTLGEIITTCALLHFKDCQGQYTDYDYNRYFAPDVTREMYVDQVLRYFAAYSITGNTPKERYFHSMLEDMIAETVSHKRILYYTFPLTVPAGGNVTVDVTTTKAPSFDFACTGSDNVGIDGYDMTPTLGSTLAFTEQSAAIENYDCIEIVRQNFGFDLTGGVTEVALDMDQEHYYIEVRERKEK